MAKIPNMELDTEVDDNSKNRGERERASENHEKDN